MSEIIHAPFRIRGHHLESDFQRAFHIRANGHPDRIAQIYSSQAQEFAYGATRDPNTEFTTVYDRDNIGYQQDVVGERGQGAQIWADNATSTMNAFNALADHHPIEIGPNPDGICSGCFVGIHCRNIPPEHDNRFTEQVIPKLIKANQNTPLTVVNYKGRLTVHTNVGTLRKAFELE